MKSPNILVISFHSPLGEEYGAANRTKQLLYALGACATPSLAIISHTPINHTEEQRLNDNYSILLIAKLKRSPINTIVDRLRYEFDRRYLNTHGFIASTHTRNAILQALPKYDIVIIQSLVLANALRIWHWPKTILDVDDVHSQLYWQQLKLESGLIHKARALRAFLYAKRRENDLHQRFSGLIVCSENDRKILAGDKKMFIIPNSYSSPQQKITLNSKSNRIGFIGLHAHKPNAQGLQWFIHKVWPRILKKLPNAELRIVGKNPPAWLTQVENVSVLGYLETIEDELATWNHTVVPILNGAGTRVKIATALAYNLPIVSTPLGAYGYIEKTNKHILLADTAKEFSAACITLMQSPCQHQCQVLAAEQYYQENLSDQAIKQKTAAMIASTH